MAGARKVVTSLAAIAAAFSPDVADVAKLHKMNSIHYPDFKSGGRQRSVKGKLERYYGKGDYTYNKELVDKVDACMDWCEQLLGLITYDKVVSVAKNHWNITDRQASSGLGAGSRSSAFNAMKTHHHIARGAAVDAPHVEEAAKVNDLINNIKDKGGFDNYQDSVEFLLLSCTIYMVKGEGAEHDKIMSAAGHNARCMYANFGAQVRDGNFASSKAELVDFREDRGEIDAEVKREFRDRTAGGKTAHVFAMAMTGAEELEEGHADRHKRCVGRLNATVAAVDAEVLRVHGARPDRFVNYPFHRWFLVVLTLHLGVVLPVEAAVCELALWAWGRNFHYGLAYHLGFLKAAEEPPPKKKARVAPAPGVTFVQSDKDLGYVPGTVFKEGAQGLGYYKDSGTDDDSDSSEDEDDEERYVTWMGCTLVYIFLTAALYDKLSKKLLAPHYSLNLCDREVYRLIEEAAQFGECKVVGDKEYLKDYLKSKDSFHCPKTWRGGSA